MDIKPIAEEAMNSLRLLDEFYEKADVEGKRYPVGMLYPEKLTFDGGMCRTPSMNLAAELICQKNKELQIKKMGRKSLLKTSSHLGSILVLLSTDFITQMSAIADLSGKIEESKIISLQSQIEL